jgi:tripeptidyl-peptidase II
VEQLVTVEIDVGRFWSTIGDTTVSVEVEFRGVRPVPNEICLSAGHGGTLVRLSSDLGDEPVSPSAKLNKWRTPLRPSSATGVVPVLSERDAYPLRQTRMHELILQYEFSQEEKGSFTPIVPSLQGVLYESAFESQLMLAFDGEKKYLGTSDAFPSSVSAPKGPVTIRLQVRHEDPKKLDCLKDLTLWIERKLEKEVSLSAYESKEAMMLSSDTFRKRILRKGSCTAAFISHPGDAKIPSACKPGDVLLGAITYESPDQALNGDGKRPGGFPVLLIVGPKQEKSPSDPEAKDPEDLRSVEQKLSDSIRDLKISHLNKLTAKEKDDGCFDSLYRTLETEYPDHLPLLMTKLQYLDSTDKKTAENRSSERLLKVVAAAEAVLALIDQDALACHFGRKTDPEDPLQVKVSLGRVHGASSHQFY